MISYTVRGMLRIIYVDTFLTRFYTRAYDVSSLLDWGDYVLCNVFHNVTMRGIKIERSDWSD